MADREFSERQFLIKAVMDALVESPRYYDSHRIDEDLGYSTVDDILSRAYLRVSMGLGGESYEEGGPNDPENPSRNAAMVVRMCFAILLRKVRTDRKWRTYCAEMFAE